MSVKAKPYIGNAVPSFAHISFSLAVLLSSRCVIVQCRIIHAPVHSANSSRMFGSHLTLLFLVRTSTKPETRSHSKQDMG